jgi:translocation and assembly module TamB
LKRLARALALAVLALGATLAWLGATNAGLRWLAERIAVASGQRIVVAGIDGHLFAPLAIARITVTGATQRVTVDDARLTWRPRRLWNGELAIDRLSAARIDVERLQPAAPLSPPRSLRLPLALNIARASVGELVVRGAGPDLRAAGLGFSLADDGARYHLRGVTVGVRDAAATGTLVIAKDAPFALAGDFAIARGGALPVSATLAVRGRLERIDARLDAARDGMTLLAAATLAPFARVALQKLLIAGDGIDPARLQPGAAHALLAFSGVFEGQPGERLLGTFSLVNAQPGRIDAERLPLRSVVGAVVGNGTAADFSTLTIDLGAAGQLSGSGHWRAGQWSLALDVAALDVAALHARLYPTRIAGRLALAGDGGALHFSARLTEREGTARFSGSYAGGRLRLDALDVASRGAHLAAAGWVERAGSRAFAARFDLAGLDPARFGDFPSARLMARGEIDGHFVPTLAIASRFELPGGDVGGRPLRGAGRFAWADGALRDALVDLDLAGNRAHVAGAFGRPGDRLVWTFDAPALERLQVGLGGRLASRGNIAGSVAAPRVAVEAHAENLRLPAGVDVARLDLALSLAAGSSGALDGRVDARTLHVAGQTIGQLHVTVAGRRDAHVASVEASAVDREQRAWQASARVSGGLDGVRRWRGQIVAFELAGPLAARLRAPALLDAGSDGVSVQNASLAFAGGVADVAQLVLRDGRVRSAGRFDAIDLATLLAYHAAPLPVSTDLRLAGDWRVDIGTTLDGRVRIVRRAGDVLSRDPALALGLQSLALDAEAVAGVVAARLVAVSTAAGRIEASGELRVTHDDWLHAPVRAALHAEVPNLRFLRAWLPPDVTADARLGVDVEAGGTLAAPTFAGSVAATAIRFAMPEEGVLIRDGTLRVQLAGDRLRLADGVLFGQEGRIRVQGAAALADPALGLRLDFERFAALTRSDRRVWLSGAARLAFVDGRLLLGGALTADRARIELPAGERPQLSDDVHVKGRAPRQPLAARRLPVRVDLALDLGRDTRFKGAGLDARLAGSVRLASAEPGLTLQGSIRVADGQYLAFGQKLDVVRGVLSFVGPPSNPGIDLLAVRKLADVTAGVKVAGTVLAPMVSLYSDPPLPDTEKLAWLVLGHGLENGGRQEYALLQTAAATLLGSGGAGLAQQLAGALNVDTLEVHPGDSENLASTVVSVGKRLSSRATVSYEQSLDGLSQLVKVLYRVSSKLRVEAQAGQPSSLDLFYTREFD